MAWEKQGRELAAAGSVKDVSRAPLAALLDKLLAAIHYVVQVRRRGSPMVGISGGGGRSKAFP